MRLLSTSLVVLPSFALSVSTLSYAQSAPASSPAAVEAKASVLSGTVSGKVVDATSKAPLQNVEVHIEGTKIGGRTGKDGTYKFTVPSGNVGKVKIVTKFLSYEAQTFERTIVDGETLVLDIELKKTALKLQEVVTTASTDQRKVEVGHAVATIKADSVASENVINGITQLLSGRVAGLTTTSMNGLLGSGTRIRIRGRNSFMLDNNPIVIVDGIRYNSKQGTWIGMYGRNPLDDLNPNDIESIEVVKGPSAATLYGTDASNGVIVVKTKRGSATKNAWRGYTNWQYTGINLNRQPLSYIGYGRSTKTGGFVICDLIGVAAGLCTQDSIRTFNVFANRATTIYRPQPAWVYGMNFSGGNPKLRYYMSADVQDAVGPLEMPKFEQQRIMKQRGITELPDEYIHPNAQTKQNLTANVTSNFTDNFDIQIQNHFTLNTLRGDQGTLNWLVESNSYVPQAPGASGNPSGSGGSYSDYNRPGEAFSQLSETMTNRFNTATTINYRVFNSALQFRGIAGVDYGNDHGKSVVKNGEGTDYWQNRAGWINEGRQTARLYTGDGSAQLQFMPSWMQLNTAVGTQYTRSVSSSLYGYGYVLPPNRTSIGSARDKYVYDGFSESIGWGSYAEQRIGINDRLFLSAAVRRDGAATFGDNYATQFYPKTSLSWNVIKEPWFPPFRFLDDFRVRFASGTSGIQPPAGTAIAYYYYNNTWTMGSVQSIAYRGSPGNPDLQPEKQHEIEGGADFDLFDQRVHLELTSYRRENRGLLVYPRVPAGLPGMYKNLGLARLKGGEMVLNLTMLRTRPIEWNVNLNTSRNNSVLVDAGGYRAAYYGGYVQGFGLGDNFGYYHITSYEDKDRNGIISGNEVAINQYHQDSFIPLGYGSTPRVTYSLNTSLNLFDNRIRVTTSFDRSMKYGGSDAYGYQGCYSYTFRTCRGIVDPSSSLWEQAKAQGMATRYASDSYYIRYDHTRWNEMSVSADLPRFLSRMARVSNSRVSIAARNLRIWAQSKSVDNVGTYWGASYDYGWNYPSVPQSNTWQIRVDLDK